MDNLTHSLVGAALAELACRTSSPARPGAPAGADRRLFLAAGVIASNLPDLDILYTGVTPAPLGYLLHHRGHTHTIAGLIVQALVIAAACRAPRLRRAIRDAGAGRFRALVGASLALHLVLDSWNTYGVHPFEPVDARWFYGDAIFIFEPWLWLLLGMAAAANARTRWGTAAVALVVAALWLVLAAAGILPPAALGGLIACAAGLAWWGRGASPRSRAAAALGGSAAFVAVMFALAGVARARTGVATGRDPRGAIVDLVVNPNPGWPVCWAVIVIERDADALVLRRGTLSLLPAWQRPDRCPSHRVDGLRPAPAGEALAWAGELRQPMGELRDRSRRDCWVRAWLQFGRAPFVRDGTIADLRFESGRGNFTAMALPPGERGCPPAMTSWGLPRADVLSGGERRGHDEEDERRARGLERAGIVHSADHAQREQDDPQPEKSEDPRRGVGRHAPHVREGPAQERREEQARGKGGTCRGRRCLTDSEDQAPGSEDAQGEDQHTML